MPCRSVPESYAAAMTSHDGSMRIWAAKGRQTRVDIEATLNRVEQELTLGHAEEPEGILTDLVNHMRPDTVLEWRTDLRDVAAQFQPKRRKRLLDLIERHAAGEMAAVRQTALADGYGAPPVATDDPEFRQELSELGERHIFQWSTHYRDCLNRHFDLYLRQLESGLDEGMVASMKRSLSEHSRDIFAKGYEHVVDRKHLTHSGAIWKSVAGLGRFLDLPLDYYSALASVTYDGTSILALRSLFSAAVTGILDGYSGARFGDETGAAVLSRFPTQWGHNLAFLTPAAAEEVGQLIEAGPLDEGLEGSVLPLLDTIESLIAKKGEDYFPLPLFGRFSSENGRLEVGVRAPESGWSKRMIEAHAYLGAAKVSTHVLADAHARQVAVLVAPLKPDVRKFVNERPTLSEVVVEGGRVEPSAGGRPSHSGMEPDDLTAPQQAQRTCDLSQYRARLSPAHAQQDAVLSCAAKERPRSTACLRPTKRRQVVVQYPPERENDGVPSTWTTLQAAPRSSRRPAGPSPFPTGDCSTIGSSTPWVRERISRRTSLHQPLQNVHPWPPTKPSGRSS